VSGVIAPLILTPSAVDADECLASRPEPLLPMGKALHIAYEYKAGRTPDPVWMFWTRETGEALLRKELNA
jgi:hypothetical protein